MAMVLMILAAGCANSSRTPSTQPMAECLVCKKNADLACVNVAVDAKTPRCVCNGKTYYFCSEECQHAFEKNPGKYLSN